MAHAFDAFAFIAARSAARQLKPSAVDRCLA
jgi:hypothetical protein